MDEEMSIFGKCTEEIKTHVTFDTKLEFSRLAHDANMKESEYLRCIINLHVHGEQEILRLQEEQLKKVAKSGPNEAQT